MPVEASPLPAHICPDSPTHMPGHLGSLVCQDVPGPVLSFVVLMSVEASPLPAHTCPDSSTLMQGHLCSLVCQDVLGPVLSFVVLMFVDASLPACTCSASPTHLPCHLC